MSTEGLGKKYSPEEIAALEKSRIQDPDKAHEEANMLTVEATRWAGENAPTAEDYDDALKKLAELEREASKGSARMDKATKPLRNILAGFVAGTGRWPELLVAALVSGGGRVGMVPEKIAKESQEKFREIFEEMPEVYERLTKDSFATARERLERWKAEAEKMATRQE